MTRSGTLGPVTTGAAVVISARNRDPVTTMPLPGRPQIFSILAQAPVIKEFLTRPKTRRHTFAPVSGFGLETGTRTGTSTARRIIGGVAVSVHYLLRQKTTPLGWLKHKAAVWSLSPDCCFTVCQVSLPRLSCLAGCPYPATPRAMSYALLIAALG